MVYGDYVFLRTSQTLDNAPLYKYTWMMHTSRDVDLGGEFDYITFPFSKGMPVPKIPVSTQPPNEYQGVEKHSALAFLQESTDNIEELFLFFDKRSMPAVLKYFQPAPSDPRSQFICTRHRGLRVIASCSDQGWCRDLF